MAATLEGISEKKGCLQEHPKRVTPGYLLLCKVSVPIDNLKRLLETRLQLQQVIVRCLADQVSRVISGEVHEGLPNEFIGLLDFPLVVLRASPISQRQQHDECCTSAPISASPKLPRFQTFLTKTKMAGAQL